MHTILGAYHGRSPMAELEEAKKEFDARHRRSRGGKTLLPKFQLAAKYYCTKGDKESYVKTLNEVVEAGDTFPAQRLTNAIAKRKAKRYLGKPREKPAGCSDARSARFESRWGRKRPRTPAFRCARWTRR